MNRVLPLAALVSGLLAVCSAEAAITTTGDIDPASDPTTWTDATYPYIGNISDGSLTITSGSVTPIIGQATLGYKTGVTGVINVEGVGSKWQDMNRLTVGYNGTGIINLTNGGTFSNQSSAYLGFTTTGIGILNVSGSGSLYTQSGAFNIGFGGGTGIVNITRGGTISLGTNSTGIGSAAASKGIMTVDGIDSTLNSNGGTSVGVSGTGTLNIVNGGTVNASAISYIGFNNGASGVAVIDGTGSKWTIANSLVIGNTGTGIRTGKLSISGGGAVSANAVSSNALSILTTDVNSKLTVNSGSGAITNNGTIRLVAGANAENGDYTPLEYGSLTGAGTVQALGGQWDAATHTVTVSDAATAQAGEVATLDLPTTQRLLITDDITGDSVGLSFKGTDTPTSLSFSATEASGSEQASLQSLLEPGQSVLSAWDFTPGEGYASGDPVYLSLDIGSGFKLSDLAIWHFDGSAWSPFSASDLAYDNLYASFTATGLSSYAVVGLAAVPIPPAVWLFGSALAGMVGFGRRKGMAAEGKLA